MATVSLLCLSPQLHHPLLLRSPNPNPNFLLPYQSPNGRSLIPLKSTPRTIISSSFSSSPVPASDRLLSALAYSLPLLNSLHYGRFLLARSVAFFALYLGVARNPSLARFVRFNAMQAVVLDVLLALPALAHRVLGGAAPARGLGFRALVLGYDIIFVAAAASFLYSVLSCVLGRTPYLPLVASAADRQL
ncbi:protein TIC 20-II, chloroplastic-like [Ananas comosus]|uniref:Protein TIC 20 n=1 Tax=Ananas comosus TaxID=4615 RepID=A0A6P5GTT9_ANACO|nr:protein TIC 20-II, chloroplastic-like [Ananas comosus]XP_020111263.1 protein TIC 20-II, chloroplastic-like [Ananas comosus]